MLRYTRTKHKQTYNLSTTFMHSYCKTLQKFLNESESFMRLFCVFMRFCQSLISFVLVFFFLTKSQSTMSRAKNFQKWRGVNVKTNDSVVKSTKEKTETVGKNIRGQSGYKGDCSHPDDDNFFLFSYSPVFLAQDFDFLFFFFLLSSSLSSATPTT